MDPDFWRGRWAERQIGFHEGKPNNFLSRHNARLTGRVLVPLCGKSEDLAYLAAHGHDVVGIELVESAVAEFFTDHKLIPTITRGTDVTVYACGGVTILCGDFFAIIRDLVGRIDSIYDRAAMIALPADLRRRYVHHLRELTPHAQRLLLVTLEYSNDRGIRPPFSIPDSEVRAQYANAPVELIDQGVETDERFVDAVERCYAIELTAARPPS
jgi:thiopurine S-methyltransferase